MTIKKYQGKTKEEAIALAKAELGVSVVIMNIKEVRPKGFLGIFSKNTYEVTAAIEDDAVPDRSFSVNRPPEPPKSQGSFQAVADEEISIPPLQNEATLKDAFAAVNQVIAENNFRPLQDVAPTSRPVQTTDSPVISQMQMTQAAPMTRMHPSRTETVSRPQPVAEPQPIQPTLEPQPMVEQPVESRIKESTGPVFHETSRATRNAASADQQSFFKMVYKVLLENEVSEVYINQLMEDMERASHSTDGLQFLISNTYQKMILKLGQPRPISLSEKRPKVAFFIGPTGVGKTTTIAKIASKFKVEHEKKVALLTADTYRIAAAEQLRTYANILDTPLTIVYAPEDISREIEKFRDYDLVLVDTAGFSHKNDVQREDMKRLLENLSEEYEREVFLVLSATTKYKDLLEITDIYQEFCQFSLIFTKLDETSAYGNIYNIRMRTQAALSYVTTGQNVPDDIEEVDTQKLVKQLLGGK